MEKCILMMLYTCVLLEKTSSCHFLNDPCWAVIQQYVLCMVFALQLFFYHMQFSVVII